MKNQLEVDQTLQSNGKQGLIVFLHLKVINLVIFPWALLTLILKLKKATPMPTVALVVDMGSWLLLMSLVLTLFYIPSICGLVAKPPAENRGRAVALIYMILIGTAYVLVD